MIRKGLMQHHCLKKEQFYSNLNMEDTTNADHTHAKQVCKDLYLKSDTLLLVAVFKNFRKMCSFRSCKISFTSWISMARSFKKNWSKTRVINWYWYAINGWKKN